MYANSQPSMYTTRHYTHDPQPNLRNNNTNSLILDRSNSSQSLPRYSNYQPPTSTIYSNERSNVGQQKSSSANNNYASTSLTRCPSTNNHIRRTSNGSNGGGSIEKTNMMSSENPFYDPARPYEQLNSPRKITSIVSPSKSGSGINKSLNLSDENPFHAVYGVYRYPSQIDPSKRITTQTANIRSTENKSLNLSDDNPFHSTYGRYHYPSQGDPTKRITETSKLTIPLIPTNDLSDDSPFSTYRPSLIREYSTNGFGGGLNSLSTSIADWTRNNPAPLSYRPIQVHRPPSDFSNHSESSSKSSYIPPVSPPRQQQQLSPPPPPPLSTRTQSQTQKVNSSAPLDKTSLNMSPDNPFAQTYGQYYYPSPEEIKTQKRTNERVTRLTEQQSIIENNRPTQITNQITEYPETEKKDINSAKGNNKFSRFDVTF
ncbi:unnamed protein product [Rotaria sp. Silwood2]|nr:unnamed protein product [Rotaria sp. Silwood2]CAF2742192.1 unnamed protein product [Rotaria sp. Silwood2]CAF2822512.1 unnamed protein product [Rotaria sp. Silwood2]CAF2883036.1 unnamed protein product [Rotaria sp. Silwood2]CAF4227526.1 unnamed protein product [Rotaria sp. Silwood2]